MAYKNILCIHTNQTRKKYRFLDHILSKLNNVIILNELQVKR